MKTAAKMKKTAEKILSEILQDSRITNYLDMLKGQSEGRYTHCINVSKRSILMGLYTDMYTKSELIELGQGGLLADIGYIKLPTELYEKSVSLNEGEYPDIQKHIEYSLEIAEELNMNAKVKEMISTHHERINGYGYPNQLTLNDLIEQDIIVAAADNYEALIEDRPYRKAYPPLSALQMMLMQRDNEYTSRIINMLMLTVMDAQYPQFG